MAAELTKFFRQDPNNLVIVSRVFPLHDLPNLHRALIHVNEGKISRIVGYSSDSWLLDADLRTLLRPNAMTGMGPVMTAPIVYRHVDVGVDQQMQCVENGIHLLETAEGEIAAHVRTMRLERTLELAVLASSQESAGAFIDKVRLEIQRANVFQGQVLSLEMDSQSTGFQVIFHPLPKIQRQDIVLPDDILDRIERNTVGFLKKADLLRASGRSVKRGILLHGKPGTGKTFTAKWLAGALDRITVILVTAEQLHIVKECCRMARLLAPTLLVLEDVDLIASERKELAPANQMNLHQLLNEMDGMAPDAQVLFLLTTNRPEALEEALAQRPGRIDQAIEYPLPDECGRRRLIQLYGRGLQLDLTDMDHLVARSKGASPAFIQEWLRMAALFAAEEDSVVEGIIKVSDRHMDLALQELALGKHELTKKLLGFTS